MFVAISVVHGKKDFFRLKILAMYKVQQRRLRWDLIKTYKILAGKERIDSQIFFQLATDTNSLWGHSKKLFVPQCSTTAQKSFFSTRVINCWNALPQHVVYASSTNALKNRLNKQPADMGEW